MTTAVLTFPPEIASRGRRRSLVRAAAEALSNPVTPAIAVAPGTDPIFGAIAAHLRARAAFKASPYGSMLPDDPGEEEAEALDEVLCDRETEALRAVLSTRPTTIAGLLAMLDYIGERPDLLQEVAEEARTFLALMATTARSLIAVT
jgi:hypothetical protein